jgi:tetratricopeptide (TPR) repeat protein
VKGTMLHKLGRLPEALAALDRAVGIAPEDVTILRTRAAIRAEAGMLIEAIADLDCAVRLQPEFKFSIAERDRLKGLLD